MPTQLTCTRARTLAVVIATIAGCTRGAPPVFDAGTGAASSLGLPNAAATTPNAPANPTATGDASGRASGDANGDASGGGANGGGANGGGAGGAPRGDAGDANGRSAEDAGALPQTRDRPEAKGAAFDARVAALWDGITSDDPERALPFFFPLAAYAQVKDVGSPARDWKLRLVAAYAQDIHALHVLVPKGATFVALDVPDARARWVEPGEEYNKLGYWRVYGSKLRWDTANGTHRTADVKSLIAWRGEWFVVHLSAIK